MALITNCIFILKNSFLSFILLLLKIQFFKNLIIMLHIFISSYATSLNVGRIIPKQKPRILFKINIKIQTESNTKQSSNKGKLIFQYNYGKIEYDYISNINLINFIFHQSSFLIINIQYSVFFI